MNLKWNLKKILVIYFVLPNPTSVLCWHGFHTKKIKNIKLWNLAMNRFWLVEITLFRVLMFDTGLVSYDIPLLRMWGKMQCHNSYDIRYKRPSEEVFTTSWKVLNSENQKRIQVNAKEIKKGETLLNDNQMVITNNACRVFLLNVVNYMFYYGILGACLFSSSQI